ncbi:DUF397 domain-containing protein [Nocardia terpenica]|uniref:DUF397 domain-containing protein n=1 Tax=Nocardia terpenica TaxID=455432 RepID=A0A291RDJ7_9NOCA|nr:DUF397 domain-containing protein [Nocardia terpenica]ATL65380.1 DUF397 domain-containing protein [Nocardia terpenica]
MSRLTPQRDTGWFKSSLSNETQTCVEIRFAGDTVLIRDSKYLRDPANDPATQPIIPIPTTDWPAFLSAATGSETKADHNLPTIDHHPSGEVTIRAANGTTLTYTAPEWSAFTTGIHANEFTAA